MIFFRYTFYNRWKKGEMMVFVFCVRFVFQRRFTFYCVRFFFNLPRKTQNVLSFIEKLFERRSKLNLRFVLFAVERKKENLPSFDVSTKFCKLQPRFFSSIQTFFLFSKKVIDAFSLAEISRKKELDYYLNPLTRRRRFFK